MTAPHTAKAIAIDVKLNVADRLGVGTVAEGVLAVLHQHNLFAGKTLHGVHK